MKKQTLVNILTIAIFGFCIHQCSNLTKIIPAQGIEYETLQAKVEINGDNKEPSTEENTLPVFSYFIEDKTQEIEFGFPQTLKEELSPRERKNQARDWLLYSIINNIELSEEGINKILHDVPIIRHGYNHALHDLEYGELRSKLLPDNSVVALIPKTSAPKQQDHLAHIAEKQRKNLGSIPDKFVVFEYSIESGTQKALLTRKADIAGTDLFSNKYLYKEKLVSNLSDLEAFMKEVQDLTFVQLQKDALLLGGRNLKSRTYKNVRVEDIAAIWQSEQKYPERGTGFSLDSAYDFEGLKKLVRENSIFVIKALRASGLISGGSYNSTYDYASNSKIIEELIEELDKKNPTFLFYVYDYALKNTDYSYGQINFATEFRKLEFQAARYDGYLQGTEVGMILYYTDLLAKMWSFNFEWQSPEKAIPEFINLPRLKLSMVYVEEARKYGEGRLWFGPNENGFQLANSTELLFERNATKIFAAAKDGMSAKNEVPASALIGAPIQWWNDHYEEVAAYEQEYERLNEVMKWSVVIGWIINNKKYSPRYLSNVKVHRKNWFSDWIKEHPELRFKKWNKVGFYPKKYKGTTTEALPMLWSPSYSLFGIEGQGMGGGVTLAKRANIAKLNPINTLKLDKTLARPNVKNIGKNTFETIKGTQFKVLDGKTIAQASSQSRLRNLYTEFGRKPITTAARNETGLAKFTATYDDIPIANLNVSPSKNGFKVGFEQRAVSQGNHLSKQLSDASNISAILKRNSYVDDFITIKSNQQYLVKLKDANKWLEIDIAKIPDVNLSPKWDFRTAGFNINSKIVRQRWIHPKEAGSIAKSNGKKWKYEIPERKVPEILDDYVNKEYRSITDKVLKSDSPARMKRMNKEFRQKELADIDKMLTDGKNPLICEEKLAQLESYFPDNPSIKMRRAIFNLNKKTSNSYKNGMNQMKEAINKLGKNDKAILDEINNLIKNSRSHFDDIKVIEDISNFKIGNTNTLLVSKKSFPKGNSVKVNPELVAKLDSKKAKLYVEDSPRLNNLDWNTSTGKTLSDVMQLYPDAILQKIPKQTMANYRPELTAKITPGFKPKIKPSINLVKVRPTTSMLNNCDEESEDCPEFYTLSMSTNI